MWIELCLPGWTSAKLHFSSVLVLKVTSANPLQQYVRGGSGCSLHPPLAGSNTYHGRNAHGPVVKQWRVQQKRQQLKFPASLLSCSSFTVCIKALKRHNSGSDQLRNTHTNANSCAWTAVFSWVVYMLRWIILLKAIRSCQQIWCLVSFFFSWFNSH